MIIETFRQAIQNVWSNKLRTFLTMLGIIIGVMAVIVIVGLGNGMTKSMRDSFSALGTNTLSVQVWGNGSRTVSVEEMYKLPTEYPELIQSISPQIDFSGSGTLKIGTTSYRWSNISGVDENYSAMKNYQIAQGRGLQYMDMKDNKHVCVIGDYLNRVAFGGNGLGQPFSTVELLARIRAMLRRKDTYLPDLLTVGSVTLNRSTYQLGFGNELQSLSGKEFQILEMLMQQPGVIISSERFITHLWGWDTSVDISVIWVHISNLRKKISAINAPMEIRFIRNAGYVLEVKNDR